LIHPHRKSSIQHWILGATCVTAALAGCGGSTDVDVGQDGGMAASSSGGSLSLGGSKATGGSKANGGSGSGTDTPCGAMPCADHTGEQTFVDADTPEDAPDTFGGATPHDPGTDADREPFIVYPSHETMFPINVSLIRHDWTEGGNDLFELRFVGPNTTVTVYTTSPTWTPTEEQWDWIAESNRGSAVELTVSGVATADPSDSWSSAPITLYFSDAAVEGAIYYWSTGTQGIMRATVSSPIPEKFYTDPAAADAETCVACHTLSRDGTRMSVGYGGEKLREVSVPERETIVPADASADPKAKGIASAWTTFSPDGEMLLIAANGKLTLIDSDTGEAIGDTAGSVPIPAGTFATHPDWAATGDRVAVSLGVKGGNKEIEGGSIAILPYDGGTWGEAEILIQSEGLTDNNFFPVWSPDSKYLAYVHAEAKSKDAVSAELRLFDVAKSEVISMVLVNQRVNNEDGVTGIGNSMPTWAPSTKPGIFWLAFSSLRAYSIVRPQDDKEDQIWIAAIDPTASDPSYAGFWAPFQSIEEGNHRAFWTHASDDMQCRCVDICGDSLDNDCNGTADEDSCSECAAEEICDDGIDNDCDCLVDDCNDEICDDGIDNDQDGATDLMDIDCQEPE
jgi:hypothetical protein